MLLSGTRRLFGTFAICLCSVWLPAAQPQETQSTTVELGVSVTDRYGRPVIGLAKDDFRVNEGNQPQTIASFSSVELPVSYGLIVDTTGSMRKNLPLVIQAASAIVGSQKQDDRAFVVRLMNGSYQLAMNWTRDRADLSRTIETFTEAKGETALTDALFSSCKYIASDGTSSSRSAHKRAVVIVSDLQDNVSRGKADEAVACLRKARVEVHPLSISEEITDPWTLGPYYKAENTLPRMLARETGGIALFPVLAQRDVISAASGILSSCRFEYRIGYSGSGLGQAGKKTEVKLAGEAAHKKHSVVTRLLEKE